MIARLVRRIAAAIRLALEPAYPAVVPCPIDPVDGRDMVPAIVEWVQSLPAGTVADFAGREYQWDTMADFTGLDLTMNRLSAVVRNPSTEFVKGKPWKSERRHLRFRDCPRIVLNDFSITGQNTRTDDGRVLDRDNRVLDEHGLPVEHKRGGWLYRPAAGGEETENEHGLAFIDCDHVEVNRPDIDAVHGDGIYHRGRRFIVRDGRISRNGRQGIATTRSSAGSKILDFLITFSRRSGIDIEPNTEDDHVDGLEIGRVHIPRSQFAAITRSGRARASDVWIHDVTTERDGVIVDCGAWWNEDWTVENLVDIGGGTPRLQFRNIVGLDLLDITAPAVGTWSVGVGLHNARDVSMTRCRFPGAADLYRASGTTRPPVVEDCVPSV